MTMWMAVMMMMMMMYQVKALMSKERLGICRHGNEQNES